MNALLLAWPCVPPVILAVVVSVAYASPTLPAWALNWGVHAGLYGIPWFVVGALLAAGVLLGAPAARLTRRNVRVAAVSVVLNAVGMALYWLGTRWAS